MRAEITYKCQILTLKDFEAIKTAFERPLLFSELQAGQKFKIHTFPSDIFLKVDPQSFNVKYYGAEEKFLAIWMTGNDTKGKLCRFPENPAVVVV